MRSSESDSKMAMKIGGEYDLHKISLRNFEKLAEEAGLARPFARRRVPELATTISDTLKTTDISNTDAANIAAIIHKRCDQTVSEFQK